jgi:hypothetical protein
MGGVWRTLKLRCLRAHKENTPRKKAEGTISDEGLGIAGVRRGLLNWQKKMPGRIAAMMGPK